MASVDRRPLPFPLSSRPSPLSVHDHSFASSSPIRAPRSSSSDLFPSASASATPIPTRRHHHSPYPHRHLRADEFDPYADLDNDEDDDDDATLTSAAAAAVGLGQADPEHMSLAEQWLSELESYEGSLEALTSSSTSSNSSSCSATSSSSSSSSSAAAASAAAATAGVSSSVAFKSELNSIETWFSSVLTEPERTATLYALLQHASQVQIKFFISVLRQMERSKRAAAASDSSSCRSPSKFRPSAITHDDLDCDLVESSDDSAFSYDQNRAISPIGSEKSASRPASVELDSPAPTPFPLHQPQQPQSQQQQQQQQQQSKFSFLSPVANNWASMINTPVSSGSPFANYQEMQTSLANAEIVANATALRLAALSTVNSRIQLDSDVRKFKRRNNTTDEFMSPSAVSVGVGSPFAASPQLYSDKPLPQMSSSAYKQSQQQQAAFMSPSPANMSSPLSAAAMRNRRAAYQQTTEPSASLLQTATPLFSSPLARPLASPQTPSKHTTPSATTPKQQQQQPFPGLTPFGFGLTGGAATSAAAPSPFSDWYNSSMSSPIVGMASFAPVTTSNEQQQQQQQQPQQNESQTQNKSQQQQQRQRTSASPAPSATSMTSSASASTTAGKQTASDGSSMGSPSSKEYLSTAASVPDDALLEDIPAWLRSLRLHKYTDNLKTLKWQDLVRLSAEELDARGVSAMGARRKMLKVFEVVRAAKAKEIEEYESSKENK